jgi:hypothetical protein
MTNTRVRFRAGPLLEEFIAVLAEHGHTTVTEIHEMFSVCILCREMATVAAVGLDRDPCFGQSQPERLQFLLYGLCAPCSALPDVKEKTAAIIFRLSSPWVC